MRTQRGEGGAYDGPIISLKKVSLKFRSPRGEVAALAGVDLDIRAGEFITVVGPSGCGKSTLLNLIVGLIEASEGNLLYRGRSARGINRDIGYVTQADNLFPWRTVLQNVMFGLEMRGIGSRAEQRDRAMQLIERVGLAAFANHYRHELSGSMRQRVNIMRALAYDPKIILLDEPFGPLDAQTRLHLQDLLLTLWSERPEILTASRAVQPGPALSRNLSARSATSRSSSSISPTRSANSIVSKGDWPSAKRVSTS